GPVGVFRRGLCVPLVGSLVDLRFDVVHPSGSIRLQLRPLALDLIGRLLSLLFRIHESQVRVYPSLVDALLQLVAGFGSRRPDARDSLVGLLLKFLESCGEVHRCSSTGPMPTGCRTLQAIKSRLPYHGEAARSLTSNRTRHRTCQPPTRIRERSNISPPGRPYALWLLRVLPNWATARPAILRDGRPHMHSQHIRP